MLAGCVFPNAACSRCVTENQPLTFKGSLSSCAAQLLHGKVFLLYFAFLCFPFPRRLDHIGPTSVTESVSRWWKVLVCGAAYWHWWVLIKLLAGLNQERRGQNTLCHLRLTRTAAPSGEDLPALCTAEQKKQIKGTIKETGFLQDFNEVMGKSPMGKTLSLLEKGF